MNLISEEKKSNLNSGSPLPRREGPGEGEVLLASALLLVHPQGVLLQPHSPMPKLAVKRMQKATMPIIQRSSDFIVGFLLSGKGISSFHPVSLGFLDHDHGFLLGALALHIGGGRQLALESQRPHHDDADDPPEDLPGPQRREPGE